MRWCVLCIAWVYTGLDLQHESTTVLSIESIRISIDMHTAIHPRIHHGYAHAHSMGKHRHSIGMSLITLGVPRLVPVIFITSIRLYRGVIVGTRGLLSRYIIGLA